MDPQRSLVLIGIGVAVIASCVVYMAFKDSCLRTYSEAPRYSSYARNGRNTCSSDTSQEEAKAAKVAVSSAKDADLLVRDLMKTAKRVAKDQGESEAYYNSLLKSVSQRFAELNKTLDDPSAKLRGDKFLQSLNEKIDSHTQSGGGRRGSDLPVREMDTKRVIDSNDDSICRVYPCLA